MGGEIHHMCNGCAGSIIDSQDEELSVDGSIGPT